MKTKIVLAVLIVLAVIGSLAGVKFLQIQKLMAAGKSFALPPETVSSFVAREENWQGSLTAIGSITADQGVNVTAEIPGLVREIAFESGAVVAKGDLIVRLDTSSEQAQLRSIQAQLDLARLNLERVRKLRSENMVAQSELDAAEATMKQTQANAEAVQTTIEKKTIRAPFAGKLGIRQVNLGQYLDTGKPIVSLQALTPMHVDFSLPQQQLSQLHTGMRVVLLTDAYPERRFEGSLTAINPDLDQATSSVSLQGTFSNSDQLLRPGMFARVQVLLPEEQKVLVVPATAVLSAPYGDSVYIIEAKTPDGGGKSQLVVRQQFIRVGQTRGDFLTVESGLKTGERIVSSGAFKLRNGRAIVENNDLAPKAAATPRPADS